MAKPFTLETFKKLLEYTFPVLAPLDVKVFSNMQGDDRIGFDKIFRNDYVITLSVSKNEVIGQVFDDDGMMIDKVESQFGYESKTFLNDILYLVDIIVRSAKQKSSFDPDEEENISINNKSIPSTSPCSQCDAFKSMFGGINHEKDCPTLN